MAAWHKCRPLEGRGGQAAGFALTWALKMARHMIHNIQPDLDVLKNSRPKYATNADSLIAARQVVALEFQTIAAANGYRRH